MPLTLIVAAALVAATTAAAAPDRTNGKPADLQAVKVVRGQVADNVPDEVDGMILGQSGATQNGGRFERGTPAAVPPDAGAPGNGPNIVRTVKPSKAIGRSLTRAAYSCRDVTGWEAGITAIGATAWKIWNHTHWCYNGSTVFYINGYLDTYTGLGWNVSNRSWGWGWWNPYWEARTHAHAHFDLTTLWVTIQTADPTVNDFIYYNGYWYES
jgi:hypothetical protein